MDFYFNIAPLFPVVSAAVHALWPGVAPGYAWLEAVRAVAWIAGTSLGIWLCVMGVTYDLHEHP